MLRVDEEIRWRYKLESRIYTPLRRSPLGHRLRIRYMEALVALTAVAVYCLGVGVFGTMSYITLPKEHESFWWCVAEALAVFIWPIYAPIVLVCWWWTR